VVVEMYAVGCKSRIEAKQSREEVEEAQGRVVSSSN
jgi:hypothetical protein